MRVVHPSVPQELRARAEAWLDADPDPATRAELEGLLAAGDVAELADRFDRRLTFGTSGVRGPLGAGPNRMNRVVIRQVAAGLAGWLTYPAGPVAPDTPGLVVVGRDGRTLSDALAGDAGAVLAGRGFVVRHLPGPLPTPVLAFAVPASGAAAGLMVTASHNPPEDNGVKVYGPDGAQLAGPDERALAGCIDAAAEGGGRGVSDLDAAGVPASGPARERLDPEVLDAYRAAVVALSVAPEARDVRVCHTALHGVAGGTVAAVLEQAGFAPPVVVASQAEPDPAFPTVASPDPEDHAAWALVLAEAARAGCDVALASDPDGDRLGVAVPTASGAWRILTGDEIGAVLVHHLLARLPAGPGSPAVGVSLTTSGLVRAVAEAGGARVLTAPAGYKWLALAARELGPGHRLVIGVDQSLGFGFAHVPEKDGVAAALLAAEAVASLRAQGRTVEDLLDDLARRYGVWRTATWSRRGSGPGSRAGLVAAVEQLRAGVPDVLAGEGHAPREFGLCGPLGEAVVWFGDRGSQVVVRVSGTEPKLKVAVQVRVAVPGRGGLAAARAQADAHAAALTAAVADCLDGPG